MGVNYSRTGHTLKKESLPGGNREEKRVDKMEGKGTRRKEGKEGDKCGESDE